MKASTGQKIKTGIFAMIGLFLLVGAIFLIGKKQNMFGNTFHVYGTFRNVGGLQPGNNVRFVGIDVGTVTSIKIVSDTLARVDMIIKDHVHPFLKSDAIASIGSDGLMGDKLINIVSVSDTATVVPNGGMLATAEPADISRIIDRVQHIAENAEVITAGLADIATQVSSGKGSVGRLLYTDDLSKELEGSVKNLKQGTAGFSENMEALKHNFLLKGYYKKQARAKEEEELKAAAADSTGHVSKKDARRAARKARRDNK